MKKVMLGGEQVTFRTKISKSKQDLARIISENGGWCDRAEWAAQDSRIDDFPLRVCFYENRPEIEKGDSRWVDGNCRPIVGSVDASRQIKNWHQTILSREEYFHLYQAPDADGWIEWKGGECPVEGDAIIDIRFRDGHEELGADADWDWEHSGGGDIIAYRPHKPEQECATNKLSSEAVSASKIALMGNSIEELVRKPTIEQLADDYRNRKDFADRKQKEADDAKADADEALRKMELAGEDIGLIVTPITAKQKPELVITDWRDLLAGDVIQCVGDAWNDDFEGREAVVTEIEDHDYKYEHRILARIGEESDWGCDFIFIRRP